ncbi:beta-1 adrenergic receptor-like [Patiria miniata]|uniref:G-protein coupled receptors family 1 profile domain-containing protein n=1 Tax=Patiria miniata TaxID=46514 RepID=A0A914AKP6_PATMI|nr:beta-1 adrenergic receptor-like [Patiria miniata]
MATMASWDIFLCVLYGFIAVAIIAGNGFCLAVLRGVNSIQRPTKFMIGSLSVADLCFGIFVVVPVIVALALDDLPSQRASFCTFFAFAVILFPRASIACILVINLDRFVAINRPLHYRDLVTMRRAYLAVGAVWFLSFTLTCLFGFLPGSSTVYHGQFHMCFFRFAGGSSFVVTNVLIVVSVAIPIVVSIGLYIFIVKIARGHVKRANSASHSIDLAMLSGAQSAQAPPNPAAKPNTKAAFTFLIVTAGFVVAWLPFLAILLHEGLKNDIVPRWLADISQIAVFTSSCWNVVIFYIRNTGFRKRARELLRLRD